MKVNICEVLNNLLGFKEKEKKTFSLRHWKQLFLVVPLLKELK